MAELTQQKPIIRITFDEMEAYMLLPEPEQGTGYTNSFLAVHLCEPFLDLCHHLLVARELLFFLLNLCLRSLA